MGRNMQFAALFAGTLAIDQAAKLAVAATFPYGEPVPLIGQILRITYVHNPGTVFGMFSGWPGTILVLKAVGLALLGAFALYVVVLDGLSRHGMPRSTLLNAALVMILASAIGNFIDRIRAGAVIDFIDMGIGQYRWYIFNPADAFLVIGAAMVLVASLTKRDAGGNDNKRTPT